MTSLLTIIMWILILTVAPFVVKRLWPFMVIKLFPKAVEENYIAKNIPYIPAAIIAFILLAIIF